MTEVESAVDLVKPHMRAALRIADSNPIGSEVFDIIEQLNSALLLLAMRLDEKETTHVSN